MSDPDAPLWIWDGPCGGLPPLDRASPAALERDVHAAAQARRAELRAIAACADPPDFDNTVAALERSGEALRLVEAMFHFLAATMASAEMKAVQARVAPVLAGLADEEAHDPALFARVDRVSREADALGLDAEQARLAGVMRDRMARRGAALDAAARGRLAAINARVADCQTRFSQNLLAEESEQLVVADSEAELDGLPAEFVKAAARCAETRGEAGRWAVANRRPQVMAVLSLARDRALRSRVWRMWMSRGANPGPRDNRPVAAEILRLRGEKARLLGYPDYAHFATAERMAGTPARALDLLRDVWAAVLPVTRAQLGELQRLADEDGVTRLAAWDRHFYAERLRRERFGLDAQALRPYLRLDGVVAAMFAAAGRLHGLAFAPLPGAPAHHPDVRAYEVRSGGEAVGALYLDLAVREAKQRGSWQVQLRSAESAGRRVLPVSVVVSNVEPAADGEPVTMGWEYANVLFHEMGHALHMLLGASRYRSLGSMSVAYDMIELPALLNERWLTDRDLMRRHLTRARSGEPIPHTMVDAVEAAIRHDRVFSVTLDFIAASIVDIRIHLAADGGAVDADAIERQTLRELSMPDAVDPVMRVPHFHHAFTDVYAAGVYSYLWADVMAADAAEAFLSAPGGLYDEDVARRWREEVLARGAAVVPDAAFRAFQGRDPEPDALLRRFALA